MELHQVLEATVSGAADKAQLEGAQKFLEDSCQADFPGFLVAVSNELANTSRSAAVRTAAGLQLKNQIVAKDEAVRIQFHNRWLALPPDVRNVIKGRVLSTLGTEQSNVSTAAQCVASIAGAELPKGEWQDVVPTLATNISNPGSSENLKAAALEAIGYICEDIHPDVLCPSANSILTAIMVGMRKEEQSQRVRLAGVQALLNSLEFTRANFDVDNERNYIMQTLCEATQTPNKKIHTVALQCLCRIMSLYYHHMQPYVAPALFPITMEAMKSSEDEIALQGIEFWSTVAEEEIDLALEAADAQENNREAPVNFMFAKATLAFIVPILMLRLAQQEEYDDEDEWNPCKSAGVCLSILASCCENDIVNLVLPFVREHLVSQDWKYRDAAVMAFGSILDGPDPTQLSPVVSQAMPALIERMSDSSVVVRDTTAWALGRVCELYPDVLVDQPCFPPLVQALHQGLSSEPRVAANCCWAFTSLAETAYLKADMADDEEEPATYSLSPVFANLIESLLQVSDRSDANTCNLRAAAYESLMELVKNSAKDCYPVIQQTLLVVLKRVEQLLGMAGNVNASNRSQYSDLQSYLCALLQSVLRRLSPTDAVQCGDAIFQAIVALLQTSSAGSVQEDAFAAVSAFMELLGPGFMPFLSAFQPFLLTGLRAVAETQVCSAAVGLVGDISRTLGGEAMLGMLDDVMVALVDLLSNTNVHRSIRPPVISAFGDIALAVGSANFQKYLQGVLSVFSQASASTTKYDMTDPDVIDYITELRDAVLLGYTGVLQGLMGEDKKPSPDVAQLEQHVLTMLELIETMAADSNHSDENVANACGLLGDLCRAFGKVLAPLVNKPDIMAMLQEGRHSKQRKTKTFATYASREIRSLAS